MIKERSILWLKQWYQLAIGLSQLAHGVVGLLAVPFGSPIAMADEALSAASWRKHTSHKGWAVSKVLIDFIFTIFGQHDHCFNAWLSEKDRKQQPQDYR